MPKDRWAKIDQATRSTAEPIEISARSIEREIDSPKLVGKPTNGFSKLDESLIYCRRESRELQLRFFWPVAADGHGPSCRRRWGQRNPRPLDEAINPAARLSTATKPMGSAGRLRTGRLLKRLTGR